MDRGMHTLEQQIQSDTSKVFLTIYKLLLSKGTDDGRWFLSGAANVFGSSGNIFIEFTETLVSNETKTLPADGMQAAKHLQPFNNEWSVTRLSDAHAVHVLCSHHNQHKISKKKKIAQNLGIFRSVRDSDDVSLCPVWGCVWSHGSQWQIPREPLIGAENMTTPFGTSFTCTSEDGVRVMNSSSL